MTLEQQKKTGILEGDLAMRKLVQELLEKEGYSVQILESPEALKHADPNLEVVVCSVPLLLPDGPAIFENLKTTRPDLGVLLIANENEMDKAQELLKAGAFTVLPRPFKTWDFVHRVKRAREMSELKRQNSWLRRKELREPNTEMKNIIEDEPTLDELEKRYIEIILKKTGGRKDKASKMLGINRRTLYRKEREYGWVPTFSAETLSRAAH